MDQLYFVIESQGDRSKVITSVHLIKQCAIRYINDELKEANANGEFKGYYVVTYRVGDPIKINALLHDSVVYNVFRGLKV